MSLKAVALTLALALAASVTHATEGRRFEILVLHNKLYARGYISTGVDDGNGVVRPYFNAQHHHFGFNASTGGGTCVLPDFDLFDPGPLVGHSIWLEMTGSFQWNNPPLSPEPGTEVILDPLGPGEWIKARFGGTAISSSTLGTLLLSASVPPEGIADLDVRYDSAVNPVDRLLGLRFVLRTDAPGVADSDTLYVLFATGGQPTPLERLHYSVLYLEARLGLYLCTPDVNGDGFLDNGDITAFIALFLTGDTAADINGDGILDNGDLGAFVTAFLEGC
ncbi:MAG: hypothetical protein ACI89L_000717 [Phycisphaerales bacterium]|jgi:hypothetical protein